MPAIHHQMLNVDQDKECNSGKLLNIPLGGLECQQSSKEEALKYMGLSRIFVVIPLISLLLIYSDLFIIDGQQISFFFFQKKVIM